MKKCCTICDAEFEGHHNRKYCNAKECQIIKQERKKERGLEYSRSSKGKAKKKEWNEKNKEKIKADKKIYHARPEVKAAKKAYQRKYNREVIHKTEYNHTCKLCNKPFTSWRSNSKFCNSICKENWWKGEEGNKYRAARKRKGPFELTCKVCKKTFIHTTSIKKTCSEECNRVRRRPMEAKWMRERRPAIVADKTSWYWKPVNVIRRRIGKGIRDSLRYKDGDIAKSNTTFELLDFTKVELIAHLESLFTDGMSWENMGEWHIDHIRPIASFNYDSTDHPEFKECWALENLQPLWATDNMSKGSLWEGKRHRRKVIQ